MSVTTIALALAIIVPGGTSADIRSEVHTLRATTPSLEAVPARRTIPLDPVPPRRTAPPSRTSGSGADIIRSVAAEHGCSGEEVRMLLDIAHHESTHRPNAVSPSGKYVGLFQLGPHLGTYDQRIDPHWNTARAIRYMRGRYGSIAKAYQFRNANNWY